MYLLFIPLSLVINLWALHSATRHLLFINSLTCVHSDKLTFQIPPPLRKKPQNERKLPGDIRRRRRRVLKCDLPFTHREEGA